MVYCYDVTNTVRTVLLLLASRRSVQRPSLTWLVVQESLGGVKRIAASDADLCMDNPPKILVGLHSDASPDERQVADSEGQVCDRLRAVPRVFAPHEWHALSQALAAELGMSFMEASAKTGHNLHHVFCSLAAAALDLKCVGAALFAYDCFTLFPAPIQIRGGR